MNQLIRIRNSSSSGIILEEFVYHPIEERVLIKDVFSNGVKNYTIYYVSKEYLIIENSTGNYTEKYVYDGDNLLAQVDTNGNKQFMHGDSKGSSSLITDINGNVVENNFYSPTGELLNGGAKSRLQYEGKEIDSLTKLYDFHFRMYNPQRPPFEQPDTLIKNVYDPQLLNRYSFERNNPYKYKDENGHQIEGLIITYILTSISLFVLGAIGHYYIEKTFEKAAEKIQETQEKREIQQREKAMQEIVKQIPNKPESVIEIADRIANEANLATKEKTNQNIAAESELPKPEVNGKQQETLEENSKKIKKSNIGNIEILTIKKELDVHKDKTERGSGDGGSGGSYCRGTCTYGPGVPSWEEKYGNNKKT